jgi:hypothetical protein
MEIFNPAATSTSCDPPLHGGGVAVPDPGVDRARSPPAASTSRSTSPAARWSRSSYAEPIEQARSAPRWRPPSSAVRWSSASARPTCRSGCRREAVEAASRVRAAPRASIQHRLPQCRRSAEAVLAALTRRAQVEIKRSEFVGPQVGEELAYNGIVAVLVVLAGIMIYIALRFEWKFSARGGGRRAARRDHRAGLLLADRHGLRPHRAGGDPRGRRLLGERQDRRLRPRPRDLPLQPQASPVEVLNLAVNQTLSRTIMTSMTTC